MPPAGTKSKKLFLALGPSQGHKVMVKVKVMALVSFERVPLMEYAC